MDNKNGALAGLRVLDLGQVIAGNFCSALLADFGAEVIKIERPGVGDSLRYMGMEKDGVSTSHMVDNRNKMCITLDLKSEKGKEIFFRLLKDADVVVENFSAGTMENMGLGYDVLKKINSRIILARISGYGQYGPKSHLYGYDKAAIAFSGLMYVTGEPDRPPVRPGLTLSDYMTGTFAALGVMFAVYNRDVTGTHEGQVVELGLYESIFRVMESIPTEYGLFGSVRERSGNTHALSTPGNNYKTKDGVWVALTSANDRVFARLCKAINREDLMTDVRYATNFARSDPNNRVTLDKIVQDWIAEHTLEECTSALETEVAYSPILSIKDIFENAHYKARDNIIHVMQDKLGEVPMQGIVPKSIYHNHAILIKFTLKYCIYKNCFIA
jgi:formyl-CoA transferase